MTQFKQQLLRYWLAMNASAFDAAIHSCAAFFGVAGAHAAVESIPALNLQQLTAVFLISFGRGLLNYLDTHPVEALLPQSVLVGPVSSPGVPANAAQDAVSGDTAYKITRPDPVGRVSSPGDTTDRTDKPDAPNGSPTNPSIH